MCGFALMIGSAGRQADRAILERMSDSIIHRGPDDSGFHVEGHVGFGFRRLSILDLSPEGHQPMTSVDGSAVIVFNGEIFNYVELRAELRALGHRFRSTGDTEVLLAAWRQWGPECLRRLNGMFAFAIHDRSTGRVFGARDRFGIKPLYVHHATDCILLASEIKAILVSGLYEHRENWHVVAKYLVAGQLDDEPTTFHKGIEQIRPGHAFDIAPDGTMKTWCWWQWPDDPLRRTDDAPERFAELFEDSVRLRLRSDVPVGVCLSGGLDSTSVICAMARQRAQTEGAKEPLNAFAYNAAEFDESSFVRDTIAQTGARLVPLETNEGTLWGSLEKALSFQDEPVHSMAALVGFGLMGLARQHGTTVVLNGQGADEVLAGYSSYFRDWWFTLASRGRIPRVLHETAAYAAAHGVKAGQLRGDLARHLMFATAGLVPGYRNVAGRMRRRRMQGDPWFTPVLTDELSNGSDAGRSFTLDSALRRSVERMPLPLYLRVEDRNSMAHSIEARLPFLDWRLVSYVMRLPPEWKLRGPWNKYLLREAMKGRIPESVRTRVDKMGFPTPSKKWFANALRQPLMDVLGSSAARQRGIYHTDRLLSQLEANRGGEIDFAGPVFRAAQFELWARLARERTAAAVV